MDVLWTPYAREDYSYWIDTNNLEIIKKINTLIKDICRNPFEGLGKPEPLKREYSGYWSRRINKEHRLIYKKSNNTILIIRCRFHYQK